MTKTTGQYTIILKLSLAEARALNFIARQEFPSGHYQAVLADGRTLTHHTYLQERQLASVAINKLEAAITKRIKALERKKGDHRAIDQTRKKGS